MTVRRIPLSFFILLLPIHTLLAVALTPPSINAFPSNSNNSYVLQDVLKAISVREKWELEDVRVSELDFAKVRCGISQSYEFRIGFEKSSLLLKFSDQVSSWNKFRKPRSDFGSLINQVSSFAVLDTLKLEGPLELRVHTHRKLSLSLPGQYLVLPLTDLETRGHANHIFIEAGIGKNLKFTDLYWDLGHITRDRIRQNRLFGFIKANIKASATIRIQLQLERDIRSNTTLKGLAEWRTRPSIQRALFEILARVEAERLKPLLIKKLKPFIQSDSVSLSNLMSNMSFTKLQSVLVPPEPLTLDVKW
ncbi:putative Signal peptidase I [Quillaja saponaria]|uniref:Signal peptidase I n=1 Tax=Quillaja saponaria TaxID=32244 RepID=A0AAD7LYG7_QUISA|nr:putative Signal peptidase I [Quillaja saponaria]